MPKQNIIYTDSTTLIEKLGEIRKWPYFFPQHHNGPGLGRFSTNNIQSSPFPSLPEIRFIQEHQDDDHPYTTLSLPAELNVDADHLAGSYVPRPNETQQSLP